MYQLGQLPIKIIDLTKLYSSKNLLFLSLYRSHVINERFRPGLMQTTAKITNSYWPEFVPVSYAIRFSARSVGEFFAILTFSSISPANFDRKLVNFFLKLVLPVILKEIQSIFLISTLHLLQKPSHN